jgi:acetaldehyde dehydrogenase
VKKPALGTNRVGVAIIGSGNIGTDLMMKVLRHAQHLSLVAMVGIDPASDGLARAERLGVLAISSGVMGLVEHPRMDEVKIVFDATSASAHARHDSILRPRGIRLIDLTPAAIGPYVVPVVNLATHINATNVNLVTCGGQATIPIVRAVADVTPVLYGEIVASIASRSAGPGTRANIDEFTETTSRAIVTVGGARTGKAIIILNPAEPPLIMRDTVYCLVEGGADRRSIEASVLGMVERVRAYVPGYRLKQPVQFDAFSGTRPGEATPAAPRLKVSVFLEVEGAAHYLPSYAGNLDIMTSAALATAEQIALAERVA